MAEFIAFNESVEVNKQTVLGIVNAMVTGKDYRYQVLLRNGINPEEKAEWINQQKWLNSFKDFATSLGEMTLFSIGKAIIDNAKFPPIKDLEEGLKSIDIAYHMNHRLDGKIMFDPASGKMTRGIGNYKLVEFNAENRNAVMICDNPYPSKFDEGIIAQIVRKFQPSGSYGSVKPDTSKESRKDGGNSPTLSC